MIRFTDKSVQQAAILTVVRAACLVFVLGVVGMFWLTDHGKAIPDQYDRVVNLAGVGALALLGRVSDSKAEAKDAVDKAVNDIVALGPPMPVPVTITDQEKVVEVAETPPDPGPDPPGPAPAPAFRRR